MESELKFTFEPEFDQQLSQQLEALAFEDHKYANNRVNSVYFDTPELDLLMEKASSDYLKTKLRLRWYDLDSKDHASALPIYFLELKQKIGSTRKKHRLAIQPSNPISSEAYINSQEFLEVKREFVRSHCPEFSGSLLSPVVLVSYDRLRLTDKFNQYRISVDTKISATCLAKQKKTVLNQSVIEIKGENIFGFPENLRRLMCFNLKKAAFSKYYESCVELNLYKQ